MKKCTFYFTTYIFLLSFLVPNSIAAQPFLTYDAQNHTINYKDNDRVQEFRIPTSLSSGLIYFEATGGDGGRKRNGSTISGKGGQGARMGAWFEIGTGSNQIPPGSEVIFIVGQRGESINNAWAESAGGGGGTAVFYKRPDNQYTLLLVAGGGNGGYSDCCTIKEDGKPGEIIQCPISGTDTYCSFTQLACACYCAAGGGGIYDPSGFYYYDVQDTRWEKCNSKRAGHLGWPGATDPYTNAVKPTGGLGGNWDVKGNTQKALGGFGFGGGAGGGGVGITQPNGGGFTPGAREKGGGSFINNMYHKNRSIVKVKRGSTNNSQGGQITYRIIPSAPNIVCNNLTVYLDQNGAKTIQASEIGAGSTDPNGLDLTYTLYDINTQRFALSLDVACIDIASPRIVNLFASNLLNGSGANSSTCTASITIKAKPFAKCKDATVRLNSNGQATLVASNINDGSSTVCGETISSYTLSKSSFGCTDVGNHTVTLTATDNNGDTNSCTANVQVVDPNPVALRCKDITVDIGHDGDFTLDPSQVDNGTGNVCGSLSYANYPQGYSVSPNTFDCSHVNTTQTVTLTLTSPGGSTGTCTSQVKVEQDVSQFARCKDITVTLNENGEVRLRPSFGQNIDDDTPWRTVLCIGATDKYELSKELFTCADIGPNSVTLTAKDGSTFIDDCTATVNVIDQTGPVVNCKPITVQMPTNGLRYFDIEPTEFLTDSYDDCGGIRNMWAWSPYKRPASDVQYTLTINSDFWPNETSWSLTSGGQVFFSGGPYNVNAGTVITETFSLSPGRYTFNMYDEYGDGQNSSFSNQIAGFRLEDEFGKLIIEGEPNDWDYQKSKNFYVGPNIYTNVVRFYCEDVGGTYPVQAMVFDNYGNGSTCKTTVTLLQDLSEAAKCKDVTVTLDQSGQNKIHTQRGSGGIDFNDGSITWSCSGSFNIALTPDQTEFNYSCANIGANPVKLSLIKGNGDILDECISTVTVQDQAGPVANCQPLTIQLPSSGTATLTGADLDAGSYDVCGTIASRQVWNSSTNPYSEKEFTLTIQFSVFSGDNSWTLTSGETTYASGGPYTSGVDDKLITETISLPPGCYELNFYDSHGDGFRFYGNGYGYFHLKDDQGNTLVEGADDWDYQKSGNFCVEENAFSNDLTFDCASVGTNSVSLLLKDNYGNGSVCNTIVTVEDNSAPSLTCKDITVPVDNKRMVSITANDVFDSSSGCGLSSMTLDKTQFDCSNLGQNTVTLTGIGQNGISGSCTAMVTVTDPGLYCNQAPVAVCQDITVSVDENCQASIKPSDVDGGSNDPDGDDLVFTLDKTTLALGSHTVILTVSDGEFTDQCNALVTAEDVSKPVPIIYSLGTIYGECSATVYELPGAIDNCGQTIFGTTNDPLTYTELGSYTITWTFDDGNGNIATATQLVEVNDYFNPIPDIPSLPTITAECSTTVTPPTATDFCEGTITGKTNDPTSFSEQGTHTITWSYDDGNGNIETQTQTVIVDDVTKPVPDQATLPTITGECSATVASIPTATDACEGIIQGTTSDPLTYSTQGTHIITWSFDDGNGNVETQTQTVIVDDVTKPTPDLATLPTIRGECPVTVSPPTATDYCSGNAIIGTTSDPLTYSTLGTHTISWSFDDGNENIETQTQTVIVEDNTPPIAKCKNLRVPVDETGNAIITPQDLDDGSTDNCGSLTFEFGDGSTEYNVFCTAGTPVLNAVELIVKDESGNQSTCFSSISSIDNLPPVAKCKDVTIELNVRGEGSYSGSSVDDGSYDNCGLRFIISPGQFLSCSDIGKGSFEVTNTVVDYAGNESSCTGMITVVDRIAPDAKCREVTVVVDENGQGTITAQQVDNGSSDACGIQSMSLDKTTISCSDQTVTLTVTDIYNNSNSCTANLILKDEIAPVPDLTTLPTIKGYCEAGLEPPFATDNCAGQVIGTTSDPLYYDKAGIYTITWVYDDGNGNASSQDQTIIIEDDIAPVPDRNNLPTLRAQCGLTVSTIPTATDRCVGTVVGTTSDPLTYNTQGIHIITWIFDDGNGNSVTQTQRVVIRDTKAPVPDQANLPALTGSCSVMITNYPTATDNCAGTVTATTDSPLEFDQEGTFAILWNYDDGNGNTSTQTQWVIVGGDAAPNARCKDISVPLGSAEKVSINASDIDNGSFDDCSSVTLLISPAGGSIFGTGLPPAPSMDIHCENGKEQNLLLSVTNEKGNTAYCQAKVTLEGMDSDSDGLLDSCDNCPDTYNPDQKDSNNNGKGDACEENSNPDPNPGGWGGWSLKKQGQEENNIITELTAFPNPFQEEINLSFNLSQEEKTTIEIFNIQGQRIHTLLSEMVPVGDHRILWDGKDQNGQSVPAGIYLVRLRAGKALINQKVILQK